MCNEESRGLDLTLKLICSVFELTSLAGQYLQVQSTLGLLAKCHYFKVCIHLADVSGICK